MLNDTDLKVDALDYEIQEEPTEDLFLENDDLDIGALDSESSDMKSSLTDQSLDIPLNQILSTAPNIIMAASTILKPEASIMIISATVGGGAVTLTSNPQIAPGINGQVIILKGGHATDTVRFDDGNGLILNSDMVLDKDVTLTLYYDGVQTNKWIELSRSCSCTPMGEISYFDTTGTSIAIAAQSDGSTNMVVVSPTTTFNSSSFEFDNGGSNNGRLRYTGRQTKFFHVACSISFAAAGAADTFVFGVAKGGTVIAASKILTRNINASDTRSTALHAYTTLATNEYLELYVGNTTDADDLTFKTLNLFAMGMDE